MEALLFSFSGIKWCKDDQPNWYMGISPLNVGFTSSKPKVIILKVLGSSLKSGMGARVLAQGSYGYGEYHGVIACNTATTPPHGVCHAFYFYRTDTEEIDVEILSSKTGSVFFSVQGGESFRVPVSDPYGYHDYGFVWQPNMVTFLLDGSTPTGFLRDPTTGADTGQLIPAVATTNIPQCPPSDSANPGTLCMSNWCGSQWSGNGPNGKDSVMLIKKASYSVP